MANVLVLKSSINGETSLTNQLINEFLAARQAAGHGDRLIEHDLSAMALPTLDRPPVRRPARGSGSAACYPQGGRPLRPAYRRVKGQRPAGDRRADV